MKLDGSWLQGVEGDYQGFLFHAPSCVSCQLQAAQEVKVEEESLGLEKEAEAERARMACEEHQQRRLHAEQADDLERLRQKQQEQERLQREQQQVVLNRG